ncbi:MAG: glycosyl transferase, partial [Pseudomonadota bacterium]
MSDSRKGRRPLVADKRYAAQPKKARKAKAKPKPKPRKAARRKAPVRRRGGLIGLFQRLIAWILRLLWRVVWRVGAVVCLLLGLMVGYYYTTLPDVTELLDGRARGSVTLLDDAGQVFAWRGDQFGGAITA